jgi:hypothetical protein
MTGRLLLKADGVLAEFWCPLDPEPPYQAPERWDGAHVAHRYSEAFGTLIKLPLGGFGPPGIRNAWPKYRSEWEDLLAMLDDGGDALRQVQERRNRVRIPPSSLEISFMDRALDWPGRYLRGRPFDSVYALNATALARAREIELEDVVRRGKHAGVRSPAEWHELALEAADRAATGLRADRLPVF